MTVARADYRGNVNIGFYGLVNDGYRLFAPRFKKHDFFGPGTTIRIAGTPLIGLFATGNSNGLLVPDIVEEHEEQQLQEADAGYTVLESRYTALGNLILCNDHGCLVSPHLDEVQDMIAEALDVPVETGTVAGLDIPGSCGVTTNQGVILHRDATEEELAHAENILGVEGDIGSVNFGSPYVHSGILANSTDLLVGNDTTGPEIQRIQDALGFL